MANVDAQTDAQLQLCLKEAFVDCTVLIIAHRLESVMGTDKILFVDNGKVTKRSLHLFQRDDELFPFRSSSSISLECY